MGSAGTKRRGDLRRLLLAAERDEVHDLGGSGASTWLRADGWRILTVRADVPTLDGDTVARFARDDGDPVAVVRTEDGDVFVPFDLDDAYFGLVTERWRKHEGRSGLPAPVLSAYYRIKAYVPRPVQISLRRALVKRQGVPEFPSWPFEASGLELLRLYARCAALSLGRDELEFEWFWPAGARAALVLSHDVESAAGLRLAIETADLEEERGFRSAFNVVGSWYPIDWGVIRELRSRGFELGIHGLFHDRSLFASRRSFERQLPALAEFAQVLGARGFRSPATHRVHSWLAELPVEYDCTIPHSDPYEPEPGGCCTIWPFFIGDVVELPYTMPQDYTLFTLLQRRSVDVWVEQARRLEEANGLIQLLTHPDPGYLGDPENRRVYAEFLDAIATHDRLWRALPAEVSDWWRRRDAEHGRDPARLGTIRIEEGGVSFVPPSARVKPESQPVAGSIE
jgi:hypothetical protein